MVRRVLSRTERVLAEIGIVAVIACVLALLPIFAPAGTPLGARLAFALVGFVAAWALVRLLAIIGRAAARLLGLDELWGYVFAIPLASAAVAWAVLALAAGSEAALGEEFAAVWPQTIAVGAGFFALFFLIYWRADRGKASGASVSPAPDAQEPLAPAGIAASALHDRLPPGFGPILALSAEDHYVRAIAQDRSELLLMPLAEAISLMPEGAGEQVHRSWWVATSAVTGHRRQGRDLRLELEGGIEAPVSRAMVARLREAGWL